MRLAPIMLMAARAVFGSPPTKSDVKSCTRGMHMPLVSLFTALQASTLLPDAALSKFEEKFPAVATRCLEKLNVCQDNNMEGFQVVQARFVGDMVDVFESLVSENTSINGAPNMPPADYALNLMVTLRSELWRIVQSGPQVCAAGSGTQVGSSNGDLLANKAMVMSPEEPVDDSSGVLDGQVYVPQL